MRSLDRSFPGGDGIRNDGYVGHAVENGFTVGRPQLTTYDPEFDLGAGEAHDLGRLDCRHFPSDGAGRPHGWEGAFDRGPGPSTAGGREHLDVDRGDGAGTSASNPAVRATYR